tara:strand:- start:1658 stop:2455 length:798 start_codon:yes stop_codon:yes gene_type:complete
MTLEKYKRKAVERPPKTTIEGEAGVGKSFFACSAPKPFVINTDDGIDEILLRIPDVMVADAVPVGDNEANAKLYDSIINTLTELAKEKHDRKSIIIDSLDRLETLAHAKVCVEHKLENGIEDLGYGKGFTYARGKIQRVLAGLNYLRDTKDMEPICVCHTQIRTINKPTLEPYDVFTLKLHKNASADIMEWSDAVLFMTFKMIIQKKDTGFGRKDSRAINTGERIILTSGSQGVDCKNRFGLPSEIPAEYGEYHKLIAESRKAAQ